MREGMSAYLGIWFQRTALHLKEVYNFLKYAEGVKDLSKEELQEYWKKAEITSTTYNEQQHFNMLIAKSKDIEFSMSEDGIIMLKTGLKDTKKTVNELSDYYSGRIGPAINYLFSLGAPIPKDLRVVQDAFPIYFVVKNYERKECYKIFEESNDHVITELESPYGKVYVGNKSVVVNLNRNIPNLDEMMRNIIFFREFERQLDTYLKSHRKIWERLEELREKKNIRYKEIDKMQDSFLDISRTLSFGKARLEQMKDILDGREAIFEPSLGKELEKLFGFGDRFVTLRTSQAYIMDLWEMTREYADSVKIILDGLNEKTTHYELVFLNFLTIIGTMGTLAALSSWDSLEGWKIGGIMLVSTLVLSLGYYYLLRWYRNAKRYTAE